MKRMLIILCALAVLTVGALTNPPAAAARRAPCDQPLRYGHTTGGNAPTEFCPDSYPVALVHPAMQLTESGLCPIEGYPLYYGHVLGSN